MLSYIAYHEAGLRQVLVLSSFLYLANVARWVANYFLYAGLIGEIAMGIVYGVPLSGILDLEWQTTFLSLGYIGLLLIVFEGGLDTPLSTLIHSLPLATIVALTGIGTPIGLSFLLKPMSGYTTLESFSAGAALSSTSLGTTFVVLKAMGNGNERNLESTRLGTVLAGAAVFDDVIGFVLASVIRILGTATSNSTVDGWPIARPLVVSLIFVALVPLLTRFILCPIFRRSIQPALMTLPSGRHLSLLLLICIMCASITICDQAGSSMLLGAYVAGLIVSALPSPLTIAEESHSIPKTTPPKAYSTAENENIIQATRENPLRTAFTVYILPVQTYIFSPIFFASIGTAIPSLSLWRGKIIWQGVVYAAMMAFAKVICGVWILVWTWGGERYETRSGKRTPSPASSSLPPALFLGFALVARGEIGLLISQIAHSEAGLLQVDAFLVTQWAIILCTIFGPISVGLLIRGVGIKQVVPARWT